jgi:hypothetical protein
VRPYLVQDGGNVKLVALDASAGKVALQFQGACSSCPSSQATLQLGCVACALVRAENDPSMSDGLSRRNRTQVNATDHKRAIHIQQQLARQGYYGVFLTLTLPATTLAPPNKTHAHRQCPLRAAQATARPRSNCAGTIWCSPPRSPDGVGFSGHHKPEQCSPSTRKQTSTCGS